MKHSQTPVQRLDAWLKKATLPADARTCIENFVVTCEMINDGDVDNFVNIEIRDFPDKVQGKLMTGFYFAYTGDNTCEYTCTNGQFYRWTRN